MVVSFRLWLVVHVCDAEFEIFAESLKSKSCYVPYSNWNLPTVHVMVIENIFLMTECSIGYYGVGAVGEAVKLPKILNVNQYFLQFSLLKFCTSHRFCSPNVCTNLYPPYMNNHYEEVHPEFANPLKLMMMKSRIWWKRNEDVDCGRIRMWNIMKHFLYSNRNQKESFSVSKSRKAQNSSKWIS